MSQICSSLNAISRGARFCAGAWKTAILTVLALAFLSGALVAGDRYKAWEKEFFELFSSRDLDRIESRIYFDPLTKAHRDSIREQIRELIRNKITKVVVYDVRESEKHAYENGVIKGGRRYRHPMPVIANLEIQSDGDEKTEPLWALGFELGLIDEKPYIIFEVETP